MHLRIKNGRPSGKNRSNAKPRGSGQEITSAVIHATSIRSNRRPSPIASAAGFSRSVIKTDFEGSDGVATSYDDTKNSKECKRPIRKIDLESFGCAIRVRPRGFTSSRILESVIRFTDPNIPASCNHPATPGAGSGREAGDAAEAEWPRNRVQGERLFSLCTIPTKLESNSSDHHRLPNHPEIQSEPPHCHKTRAPVRSWVPDSKQKAFSRKH